MSAARHEIPACDVQLSLLEAFELRCDGEPVPLPPNAQRLLAFLALRTRPVLRGHVAGMLWLDAAEGRAIANLRSSLWRLRRPGLHLVDAGTDQLRLAPELRVDFQEGEALARRLLDGTDGVEGDSLDWAPLAAELLPDWYDDWVLIERERYRQLGLHALEALAEHHLAARRCQPALQAALAAVSGEPLRESAHRILIQVHLAEGNSSEAIRQYRFYCSLIRERLGLGPSAQMRALVSTLTP
jgi:DNA-binding SARP family transcriptional activator